MKMTPAKAKAIAREAHSGQTDKQGQPYHLHPERVAASPLLKGAPDFVKVAAHLHDVLEDTPLTMRELFGMGMELFSGILLDRVTRRKGETYDQFILRIAASGERWAIRIKLADLADNMSRPLPGYESLLKRYAKAKARLERTLVAIEEPLEDC